MPPSSHCKTCFDLDLSRFPKPHLDVDECSIGQTAYHWITSSELRSSARRPRNHHGNQTRGCWTCLMLSNAIETLILQAQLVDRLRGVSAENLEYQIAITDKDEDLGVGEKWSRQVRTERPGSRSLCLVLRVTPPPRRGQVEDTAEEYEVELYNPPDAPPSPWPAIGRAGEVPTKPTGEECAQIIRPWLQTCSENHIICQQLYHSPNYASHLPKRVLDLSSNSIRLIETRGQIGQYIALSHSWGKKQPLVTTRETYAERMRGIPLQSLPPTFRDAISITRSLGIRFIWIDSLCIIQEDKLDWEQQSAVMADIYEGCYLNIATMRSADAFQGCLGPRWTSTDTLAWAAEVEDAVSISSDEPSERTSL